MFKDVFKTDGFANRVALYVPSTTNVNETLDSNTADQVTNRVLRFFGEMFGGATGIPARGSWVSESGELVIEQVTIVYSFTDNLTKENLVSVHEFALRLKAELKQESISVEVNGVLAFV